MDRYFLNGWGVFQSWLDFIQLEYEHSFKI